MGKIVALKKHTPFRSVLVANRGEIALRIIRTLQAEGYRAIAVYTDADTDSPHVHMADHAVRIGGGPVAQSYLSIETLIQAARSSGAEAIHPGYGFLSENADFVRACQQAGLIFIGPSAEAVALMGNKAAAKRAMQEANVPCVPGYEGGDQSDETLISEAAKIGFPVMIKAAAGGGGRGMRVVASKKEFASQLDIARREAASAFGDDSVILEKALLDCRHVEVQILADRDGNVIHLGERDCSVQRRHQKIVEEAPCPALTDNQRRKLTAAAVNAAKSIGYEGAGTVEFLLDEKGNFYFLEMNTRLQVEHPVTEMITGLDLVSLQVSVAQGKPLNLRQKDIEFEGHAIEVRLYAEDPAADFLPSTGKIDYLHLEEDEDLRIDSGIEEGQTVSPHYDPMLAKVIAYGDSREEAREWLVENLEECAVFGVATNRDLLLRILEHSTFSRGQATTDFLEHALENGELAAPSLAPAAIVLAAAYVLDHQIEASENQAVHVPPDMIGWSSNARLGSSISLFDGEDHYNVFLKFNRDKSLSAKLNGETYLIGDPFTFPLVNGEKLGERHVLVTHEAVHLSFSRQKVTLLRQRSRESSSGAGTSDIRSPLHGSLTEISVSAGDIVSVGDTLGTVEAMKMQHPLKSAVSGRVSKVLAKPGDQVSAGQLIIAIEAEEQSS